MSAAGALIAMSAQRSGAATGDSQQHLLMSPANPPVTQRHQGWLNRLNWQGFSATSGELADNECRLFRLNGNQR
jgi:hypothetical protein